MSSTAQKAIIWIAAAMLLLILADYYPKMAKLFLGLLIVSVLLVHYKEYVGFLNQMTGTVSLGGITGGGASATPPPAQGATPHLQ